MKYICRYVVNSFEFLSHLSGDWSMFKRHVINSWRLLSFKFGNTKYNRFFPNMKSFQMILFDDHHKHFFLVQSNLAIRNGLIRNKLVLRNHFLWPICHLLHKNKELLALRNNFRATKMFFIAKFDCIRKFFYFKILPNFLFWYFFWKKILLFL